MSKKDDEEPKVGFWTKEEEENFERIAQDVGITPEQVKEVHLATRVIEQEVENINQVIAQNEPEQETNTNQVIVEKEPKQEESTTIVKKAKTILPYLDNIQNGLAACTEVAYRMSGVKSYVQFTGAANEVKELRALIREIIPVIKEAIPVIKEAIPVVKETVKNLAEANSGIVAMGQALAGAAPVVTDTANTTQGIMKPFKRLAKGMAKAAKAEQRRRDKEKIFWANFRKKFKNFAKKIKNFFDNLWPNRHKEPKSSIASTIENTEAIETQITPQEEQNILPQSPQSIQTNPTPQTEVTITRRKKTTTPQNHNNIDWISRLRSAGVPEEDLKEVQSDPNMQPPPNQNSRPRSRSFTERELDRKKPNPHHAKGKG